MCNGTQPEHAVQKQSVIEKLGGENQYEFLIISYCENILEDDRLNGIYEDYDIDSLASLQKNLLDLSFHQAGNISPKSVEDETRNRIVMQNYALFEKGLNAHHFDLLREHFVSALHNCWIQDDIFDMCQQRFDRLRSIFEEQGNEVENTLIQRRVVEVCILTARSA